MIQIKANCKINIGLDILSRREDGYHELSTIMFPVKGLYDEICVERTTESDIVFRSEGLIVDCPAEDNICVKAARLMQRLYNTPNVEISLKKNIPFGAGLGGGSADGTAVILAMNDLFELGAIEQRLIEIAAMIGSDTAFFVRNTPQLCQGRGEIMTPIDISLDGKWIAIIKPDAHISTREAYSAITPQYPSIPLEQRILSPIEEWQHTIKNDFEKSIFASHPTIAQVKQDMLLSGAVYAAMSGSGSAVFGIFTNEKEAQKMSPFTPYIYKL